MKVELYCKIVGGPYDGGFVDFKSHDLNEAEYRNIISEMVFLNLDGHSYKLEKIDRVNKTAEAVW